MDKKKKKRRRRKVSKKLKIFAVCFLIAGAVVFALMSPIFGIKQITVYGNEKIETETIISLSGLKIGDNIFKNRSNDVSAKIKQEPYIERVNINRKLPNTIEISVKEREVAYQIQVIDSYVYIDYQGYILEKSSEEMQVPILEGMKTIQDELLNGKRICKEDINYLNTILKIVENAKNIEIYDLITKIIIENNTYVLYFKNENKYAYLGNSSDITNKMLYVKTILQAEKGKTGNIYVDGERPRFREETL